MFSNKSVFQSEPEVLPCFELNYKFLERDAKPLSLVTTRKQENPVNTAQKMASKSSTKQDGEATIHVLTFTISRYLPYINRGLIAMLNFQCFPSDTSFLSVSSKWFGNLRKLFIDKRLINSLKYHYLSLRLVWSLFKKQAQGTNIIFVKIVYDWPCFLFANAMTVVTVGLWNGFRERALSV